MKSPIALVVAALWLPVIAAAGSEEMKPPAAKSVPPFDRMKTLVGTWGGKGSDGKPVEATYALLSDGSALVETLAPGTEKEMVTVYHTDGDRLMMTHYCSMHNQPRMRTGPSPSADGPLTFDFVDVTGLPSPDAGHMRKLVVTFRDRDHFAQEWTWSNRGQEGTVVFDFVRKR